MGTLAVHTVHQCSACANDSLTLIARTKRKLQTSMYKENKKRLQWNGNKSLLHNTNTGY